MIGEHRRNADDHSKRASNLDQNLLRFLGACRLFQAEAQCLGRMGASAVGSGAVSLCRALQDDRDVRVRRRAAMALGQLAAYAGPSGAQALARALRVDRDAQVRCRCAEALGCVRPSEADGKSLIEGLAAHESVDLRWRCAMSIGAGRLGGL